MTTLKPSEMQIKLTREQKEAVGLLSIGTFLEYFDLMLYVHMAVLLNELFFPKTDPHTTNLLSALAFCSTYFFRPFGALLFGWIGDNIGRKSTIIITTALMAICCAIMAFLPTYDEIGVTAAYVMIGCRILQGMSSMGEVVGALLYLTEFIKKPAKYFIVSLIPIFCDLGSTCAIFFATLATSHFHNWRIAFWFGTILASIGVVARSALRETPEFVDATKRLEKIKETIKIDKNYSTQENELLHEKLNKKSALALFLMECMWPLCFYFGYVYCGDILKKDFNYTSAEVISHNFVIAMITMCFSIMNSILCKFFHPLRIVRYRLIISFAVYFFIPFWLNRMISPFEVGILQAIIVFLPPDPKFAVSAIYFHFPVFIRFRAAAFLYALSRALTYVVTAFGTVYLVNWFNNWGVFVGLFVVSIGVFYGVNHFLKLETQDPRGS